MIKKIIPYFLIFLIVFIIFLGNYKSNTWLIGWDNLNPEFNFGLNLKRQIFGSFQEYQGLGSVGGLMISTAIPYTIFLWILSLFSSLSMLRYIFTFLMLLLGGYGMFFLMKNLILKNKNNEEKIIGSLASALFYILNLGTMQIFYVPFEPFVIFYGFLPWLIFIFIKNLEELNKKNIISFFIINFLAVPSFYVPTIFIVYLIILFLLLISLIIQKKEIEIIKKFLKLFFLILIINSFWLFNFLTFIKTNINSPIEAHMNYMSTEDIYLKNKKFGDLKSIIQLKGFLFDFLDIDKTGKYENMMKQWLLFTQNKLIEIIIYFNFLIIIIGFFYSIKKKCSFNLFFIILFLFSFLILANNTPILSLFNDLLRKIPYFSQIFRVPFNKFVYSTIFSYSLFFGIGILSLFNLLNKKNFLKNILFLLIIFLFLTNMPSFYGNFIYQKMKVKIPDEYFNLMEYFKNKSDGKIAIFPQYSYWNWNFYSWGYTGTGFLWYGLKQPLLDRAFDGYNQYNENYYWEISYALYSKNLELFEKNLNKYQIKWLILDKNIIANPSPKILFNEEFKELINRSKNIKLLNKFNNLEIYEYNQDNIQEISIKNNLLSIIPNYKWNNLDKAYEDYGDYISSINSLSNQKKVYYPFRSIFTNRKNKDINFNFKENNDYFIFKSTIPKQFSKIINIDEKTKEIIEINKDDLSKIKILKSEIFFFNNNLVIKIPKIYGLYSYNLKENDNFYKIKKATCNYLTSNKYSLEKIIKNKEKIIKLKSEDGSSCIIIDLPYLTHSLGYLIKIKAKNIKGKTLLLNLINKENKRKEIDIYLDKNNNFKDYIFIQPPLKNDGLGYELVLDNISIGKELSINEISDITINPIPYELITSIKLFSPQFYLLSDRSKDRTSDLDYFEAKKLNYFFYEVSIPYFTIEKNDNLTLY
ncbi:MAG: hypothetical protein N2114_01650, partial [Candidatus Goldbacteria bacterium]|nr:hypothetical protein [Candidatus Goldiibacteriota bacterium]